MRFVFKVISSLALVSSLSLGAQVLAVVNGNNVTTEVAPKDFSTMDKEAQKEIVKRLIQKRLASDYALSLDVVKSEEFNKIFEHILEMDNAKDEEKAINLADILKEDAGIKGYTSEQLHSKKGLLAFDFLLNKKAEEFEADEKKLIEYYESRKYQYDTPAMIELLSIVVEKEDLAKEIIEKISKAEDRLKVFSDLAKEHSLAPSAKKHGYFGKMPISDLNNTLKPVLKDMKRNDFTQEPIKTEFGYQVFYVLNDIPEFNSTFEQVKSRVEDSYVRAEVKNWAISKIHELEEKAEIINKL